MFRTRTGTAFGLFSLAPAMDVRPGFLHLSLLVFQSFSYQGHRFRGWLWLRRHKRHGHGGLFIDGNPSSPFETENIFVVLISWSGLDVGRDRVSPVGDYEAPFEFTGKIRRVIIDLGDDQELDHAAEAAWELARE